VWRRTPLLVNTFPTIFGSKLFSRSRIHELKILLSFLWGGGEGGEKYVSSGDLTAGGVTESAVMSYGYHVRFLNSESPLQQTHCNQVKINSYSKSYKVGRTLKDYKRLSHLE